LSNINFGASVIFRSHGRSYEKAEAVILILKKMGSIYKFLGFLANLRPLFTLDRLYNLIAENRYRMFENGRSATRKIS
jgi:predicted DCC family thiol-disulfide oxidoreductase YuxK